MNTVAILAAREYLERAKSRGFIIGTIIGILGIIGISFISLIGSFLAGQLTTSIALVGPDAKTTKMLDEALREDHKVAIQPYKSRGPNIGPALKRQVVSGQYDAALSAYRNADGSLGFAY